MASKLCCTAEQEGHPDSPQLPNARLAEPPAVTQLPLLPKLDQSAISLFTSDQTGDLHELRNIFDHVKDNDSAHASPTKAPSRARFKKPSIYSLHSIHKMKSMRSLIRRRFSKDLVKRSFEYQLSDAGSGVSLATDTVVRQKPDGPAVQLKLTKDDLRKDLLSDKRPEDGGYDSDAQVLHDIAKNLERRMPNKRPSIHSIEWTTSTGSKPTLESSSKSCQSSDRIHDLQPYHIKTNQSVSLSARIGQVFSSPNLQVETRQAQERRLRRSHSATSTRLPEHSPLSPLRLPSLKSHDQDGIPWSVALNESLHLSQFFVPPHLLTPKHSQTSLKLLANSGRLGCKLQDHKTTSCEHPVQVEDEETTAPPTAVKIRLQEPTALTTPRQSGSLKVNARLDISPFPPGLMKEQEGISEDEPRRSVHLYSMRISHHLRSGSLLSWDTLANESEPPSSSSAVRDRSLSDFNRISKSQQQHDRNRRHTSSSGFASSQVPSKWGKVLSDGRAEDKSSIYSSRPQSPLDGPLNRFDGSMLNLPQTPMYMFSTARSSFDHNKLRRSISYPTDNDDTPKPTHKEGSSNLRDTAGNSVVSRQSNDIFRLARYNSVASTKVSKFREELSPSPVRKRLIPSASIMRFLTPKLPSMRSHSEANIKPDDVVPDVDGSLELRHSTSQRQRCQSKSMISLETEQKALARSKNTDPMWERALQTHHDEKAAMFLPENKERATQARPFRERSGSAAPSRMSLESEVARNLSVPKRFSAPLLGPSPSNVELKYAPLLFTRRTALTGTGINAVDPAQDIQLRFGQQTDAAETVGAWGRYPSHSRPDRTKSAGPSDNVQVRDFALEAAIKFAMGNNSDGGNVEEDIDPSMRPVTPPLLPGQKKRKKKIGDTRMAKSHSMTFGKSFLKHYVKMFRSQSIEFHKHGQGHRSSVATSGTLEYPELEMLPNVWRRGIAEEASHEIVDTGVAQGTTSKEVSPGNEKNPSKAKEGVSTAALQALSAGNSRPTTSNLLQAGFDGTQDTARIWSAYYENCLPTFPRGSTELDFAMEDFGRQTRRSLESRRASMYSRTVPIRRTRHSRNASRMSHLSIASHGSARPSFVSMGENDHGIDEGSEISVRRSTMDLVSMYKEQENMEMERVLKIARTESMKGL